MKIRTPFLALAMAAGLLCSCVQPTGLTYQPTMTPQERAESERYIRQVDDQDYARRDRERMSDARATEMATRHAPTHVTTNTTRNTFWFW